MCHGCKAYLDIITELRELTIEQEKRTCKYIFN